MDTPLTSQEDARLVESSGQIHMHAFRIAIGILTGLALCCFIVRLAIRLTYQHQLRLDDAFLILAAICLCVATGILYSITYFLYLHSAALLTPQLLPLLLDNFGTLINLDKRVYPFLALIWTTTFAVKACFLVFMRPMTWHISRAVNWYYWFIVVFCAISWAYVVAEPFLICPYFGLSAVKCFDSTVDGTKTLGLTVSVTMLDMLSDVMVVSIPIIILRNSLLSRSTKYGLAIFLCLSVFMLICAIVRIAGFRYNGVEDDTWEFFWQHTEGAVSVMMASITAFRTLFIQKKHRSEDVPSPGSPREGGLVHRLFARFQSAARAKPENHQARRTSAMIKLPKIPSPVFTGIHSFIRRNNRTDASDGTFATLDSTLDSFEPDYHTALVTSARAARGQ